MNKYWIFAGLLAVGGIAYASINKVDNFINQFGFTIGDYGIDFANADLKKLSVPAHVTANLMNNEDYEPTINSMVVIVFTKDAKGNYFELFRSRPADAFKIAKRTTTQKKLVFDIPLKSIGLDIVELAKKRFGGTKIPFKFQVNTVFKGQLFTEVVEKEF